MSMQADNPVPAGLSMYYFEVSVLEATEDRP